MNQSNHTPESLKDVPRLQQKEPSLVEMWKALTPKERENFTKEISIGLKQGGAL